MSAVCARAQVFGEGQARRRCGRGARPLVCRGLGTLAVCIAAGGRFHVQLLGVVSIGVFAASWFLWRVLDMTLSARVSRSAERLGQDIGELSTEAYPEFVLMPEEDDGGGSGSDARS